MRHNAILATAATALSVMTVLVLVTTFRVPPLIARPAAALATNQPSRIPGSPTATTAPPHPMVNTAKLANLVPGSLSVLVRDRSTGRDLVSYQPNASFSSASLVKLLIAVEALTRDIPEGTVREMIERSDDTTASVLWAELGGRDIVREWAATIGMTHTLPPSAENPGRWGDTRITAADIARFYAYLMDKAPTKVRTVILAAMGKATERGADDFRQYFGIPDAVRKTDWRIKQGWSCCDPDIDRHTSGLLDHQRYIVVILSNQPHSVGELAASQRITALAQYLAETFGWA